MGSSGQIHMQTRAVSGSWLIPADRRSGTASCNSCVDIINASNDYRGLVSYRNKIYTTFRNFYSSKLIPMGLFKHGTKFIYTTKIPVI